jgi:hypothetical protein
MMTTEMATGTVEITTTEAKPVTELWDLLSEQERAEFRNVALELKQAASMACTPEEARIRMLAVLETQKPSYAGKAQAYVAWIKKQGWDDRTWAQRLAILSLVATLPISEKRPAWPRSVTGCGSPFLS